ncbi:MAG: M23 family metallopeptidase [Prevotellaceae bacterium]|jgi:murein DD-endopeptidase MepM/ murein hydrolase activator NlpD|nr:M23 family metallopeptidase [Prevotellaceae bacterium]
MPRQKYKLNTESLDFEVIKIPLRRKTQRFFVMFLLSLILFFIYAYIYSQFFESPKIILLKSETVNIQLKYDFLLKDIENADKSITTINNRDQNVYRTLFGLDKIFYNANKKNTDAQNGDLLHNVNKTFTGLDDFRRKIYIQSKSFDIISKYAANMEKMTLCMPSIPPIDLGEVRRIGNYGYRIDPFFGDWRHHDGLDFTTDTGNPIYATGDGVIAAVVYSNSPTSYGNRIDIEHGFGYLTRYAHLSKILVKEGMQVKRGDMIGLSGNTGKSTGPHLHYEVRYYGKPMYPKKYYVDESAEISYDQIINRDKK